MTHHLASAATISESTPGIGLSSRTAAGELICLLKQLTQSLWFKINRRPDTRPHRVQIDLP